MKEEYNVKVKVNIKRKRSKGQVSDESKQHKFEEHRVEEHKVEGVDENNITIASLRKRKRVVYRISSSSESEDVEDYVDSEKDWISLFKKKTAHLEMMIGDVDQMIMIANTDFPNSKLLKDVINDWKSLLTKYSDKEEPAQEDEREVMAEEEHVDKEPVKEYESPAQEIGKEQPAQEDDREVMAEEEHVDKEPVKEYESPAQEIGKEQPAQEDDRDVMAEDEHVDKEPVKEYESPAQEIGKEYESPAQEIGKEVNEMGQHVEKEIYAKETTTQKHEQEADKKNVESSNSGAGYTESQVSITPTHMQEIIQAWDTAEKNKMNQVKNAECGEQYDEKAGTPNVRNEEIDAKETTAQEPTKEADKQNVEDSKCGAEYTQSQVSITATHMEEIIQACDKTEKSKMNQDKNDECQEQCVEKAGTPKIGDEVDVESLIQKLPILKTNGLFDEPSFDLFISQLTPDVDTSKPPKTVITPVPMAKLSPAQEHAATTLHASTSAHARIENPPPPAPVLHQVQQPRIQSPPPAPLLHQVQPPAVQRPSRVTRPGDALRSPYKERKVAVGKRLTKLELIMGKCFLYGDGEKRLKASFCKAKDSYREMDDHVFGEEDGDIDWNTEDELEIQNIVPSSCSTLVTRDAEAIVSNSEASSSAGPSNSILVEHFLDMGFSENLVIKAIKENVEGDTDSVLETLLTLSALDNSPEGHGSCDLNSHQQQQCVNSDELSSDYDESLLEDFSESDSWSDNEITENGDSLPKHEETILHLASMGFTVEEASAAMERCGPDASIAELTDLIYAAQLAKADAIFFEEEKPKNLCGLSGKLKRKMYKLEAQKKKQKGPLAEEDELIRIPKPMIGYGVPSESGVITHRTLPDAAIGPPFFYYENVALAPKGVWDTISRFLYDIAPEFVDSKYFCAAARKRGYVHNLPINNRFPIIPLPPTTIAEAFPLTKKWWPEWDKRTKLNCLQTVYGSAKMTDRVRKALERWGENPPSHVQKFVIEQCRKWNLVWVGKNKVATLEPDEVEMLLGFPKNHTRGGGISRTDRYKSLGNSFQVDTVAYHLSVLKAIFPNGINVLSLFSGIGGAEVALDRLKIPLKNVVSVEISEANRDIVRSWWEQTNQKGNLVHLSDIQQVNADTLERYITSFGGFDLVIGGSPCNNLTGGNRVSRDGLEGEHSVLFYDFFRILESVKCIMSEQS
ncbi:hypothetical protein SSX86_014625 [Deinandra increscens subsp. villosa]|uniref:DNA (cytosine-5-)-methyltransferase n=1 Tax=Deinandra increscens subsp. villosa TaxID=3103831 RepID=A0AAP0D9S8_9ASTR